MTSRQLVALTWILHVLLIVALTPGPDSLFIMVQVVFVLRFAAWAIRAWGSAS